MRKDITRFPGVTLIELLIVTSILAILIIASLFYVRSSMPKARDGERKADLKKISVALEQYRSDYGGYPTGMARSGNTPIAQSACGTDTVLAPYLSEVPCDPESNRPYRYNPLGSCGPGKRTINVCSQYRILTHLEYTQDPIIEELCPQATGENHCSGTVQRIDVPGSEAVSGVRPWLNYGVAAGSTVLR